MNRQEMIEKTIKYWLIDTDIGDDIDDALAIGYALEKKIHIVGITTVYRDAGKRVLLAKKLLQYKGVTQVPVYAGYSNPITKNPVIIGKMNYEADGEAEKANPERAIDFIADCAEKYGLELGILSIGAQTNIAKAWQKHPDKMKKIGLLAIMGGCFTLHHNEWNIACDPTAAKIVSESTMNIFYMPWELTKEISIGRENYDYILNLHTNDMQGYLAELVRQWKSRNGYIPLLHDPAALICATNERMCFKKDVSFHVLDDGIGAGLTINVDSLDLAALPKFYSRRISLAVDADNDAIVEEFMKETFRLKGFCRKTASV